MTYRPHWLLAFGGRLASSEIWVNTLRFAIPNGPFELPESWMSSGEDMIDDIVNDLRGYFANPGCLWSSNCRVDWVKLNRLDENGRYADPTQTVARYLTGTDQFAGPGSSVSLPTFAACCVTLTTARQRGPASKGRIFVPMPNIAAIGTDGRIQFKSGSTASLQGLFGPLNDWPGIDLPDAPALHVISDRGAPGPAEPITGWRVGDVLDVQRKRKNALVENYVAHTLTP